MLALEGHAGAVYALAFAPDGRTLASAGRDRTVRLWEGGQEFRRLTGHVGPVRCLSFRADGRALASGGDTDDRSIWLWNTDPASPGYGTGRPVLKMPFKFAVTGLAFAPDGTALYAAGGDRLRSESAGLVQHLDLASERLTPVPHPGRSSNVWALDLAPNGHTLAWGHGAAGIAVRDVRRQDGIELPQLPKCPLAVRFSPDSKLLAAAVDYTVRVFGLARPHAIATLAGHKGLVLALAFSPDGRTLASGSRDGTIRFWDVASRCERAVFPWPVGAVWAVAFAPDGLRAAAAGERGAIFVWDVDDA